MNPYPGPNSVLIIDNAKIHKCQALQEVIEAAGTFPMFTFLLEKLPDVKGLGCLLIFLPPYSPDLNPIEEAFSCCTSFRPHILSTRS